MAKERPSDDGKDIEQAIIVKLSHPSEKEKEAPLSNSKEKEAENEEKEKDIALLPLTTSQQKLRNDKQTFNEWIAANKKIYDFVTDIETSWQAHMFVTISMFSVLTGIMEIVTGTFIDDEDAKSIVLVAGGIIGIIAGA